MTQKTRHGIVSGRARRAVVTAAALAVAATACTGVPQAGGGERTGLVREVEDVSGLRPVKPFTLVTKTAADDPRRFEEARLIVEAWQAAGLPARLEALSETELSRRTFATKDYDTYLIAYDPTLERLDPDDFLARFWSGNAGPDGTNVSGHKNPAYDRLYLAQLRATQEQERLRLVREAQRQLYKDQPAAPYVHQAIGGAFNSRDWDNEVIALGNPVYHFWNSIGMRPTGERRTLTVGVTSEVETLNPVTAATTESTIPLSHIYDSLVRVGPQGEPVNWAASDVKVEGRNVVVELRDGMRFHDGRPVTGQDVAFTINYLIDKEAPLYAPKLESVESTSVQGNRVTIELKAPSASFIPVALSTTPILPRHIWADVDDPAAFANNRPIGSGPFRFKSRQLGSSLRLQANEQHFRPPRADGIVWATFGSLDAEIGALQQGEIDILGDFVSVSQLDALKDAEGVRVVGKTSHGWNGVHFNMTREPFNDRHFRRALAALIPVRDIQQIVLAGSGVAAGSVIAPNLDWDDPSLGAFPRGTQYARAELETAGYVIGPDGRLYYPTADKDQRVTQPTS